MDAAEDEKTGEAADDIGAEVLGVVASAFGNPGLMPFIEAADDSHNKHDDGEQARPIGMILAQAIESGGKESSATEEIAEMNDFIEVGDFDARFDCDRSRRQIPERAEPSEIQDQPEMRAFGEGGQVHESKTP